MANQPTIQVLNRLTEDPPRITVHIGNLSDPPEAVELEVALRMVRDTIRRAIQSRPQTISLEGLRKAALAAGLTREQTDAILDQLQ